MGISIASDCNLMQRIPSENGALSTELPFDHLALAKENRCDCDLRLWGRSGRDAGRIHVRDGSDLSFKIPLATHRAQTICLKRVGNARFTSLKESFAILSLQCCASLRADS